MINIIIQIQSQLITITYDTKVYYIILKWGFRIKIHLSQIVVSIQYNACKDSNNSLFFYNLKF